MSFQIHQKLKLLRTAFKEKFHTPIQVSVREAEQALSAAQAALHDNPQDITLASVERACAQNLVEAKKLYAPFLQQRAKISWLKYGDENKASSTIVSIIDEFITR